MNALKQLDKSKLDVKKILQSLVLFFVSILMVLTLPIVTLVRLIGRLKDKEFMTFKGYKPENFVLKYIINQWWSEKEEAQNKRTFVYFLFPAMFAFVLFVIVPFLQGIYVSFTDWNGLNTGRENFIGLENYRSIFSDVRFLYALWRTILYAALNIIAINVVAFSLALLVTQNLKLKNIYRAGFFMPNLIGGLVLGYIWQFIFNRAITTIGPSFSDSFLTDGTSALFALIFVVTWQYAGYIMMIYIAAIQNIPQDLVEASTIDGANAFQRLKNITFPLVAQAFTVAMFLTLVTSFKQFDTVVSLTQGGPPELMPQWFTNIFGTGDQTIVNATSLIASDIYDTAFVFNRLGTGQAKAIIFFVFLLVISLLQVYYNKRKEIEL